MEYRACASCVWWGRNSDNGPLQGDILDDFARCYGWGPMNTTPSAESYWPVTHEDDYCPKFKDGEP